MKLPKGITIKKIITKPKEIQKLEEPTANETVITDQEENSLTENNESSTDDEKGDIKELMKPEKITKGWNFVKVKSMKYICIKCNATFLDSYELKKHIMSDKPCVLVVITCPICNKQFANKSSCSAHLKAHTDKVRYLSYRKEWKLEGY